MRRMPAALASRRAADDDEWEVRDGKKWRFRLSLSVRPPRGAKIKPKHAQCSKPKVTVSV